jgi:hypothetical protein
MALDALGVLQAARTITATANSTGLDLQNGTIQRNMWANVVATTVSGTLPTAAYKVQGSADNTTFVDITGSETLTAAGALDIPFTTSLRYVRLVTTIGGTTPSFQDSAFIGIGPHAGVLA